MENIIEKCIKNIEYIKYTEYWPTSSTFKLDCMETGAKASKTTHKKHHIVRKLEGEAKLNYL